VITFLGSLYVLNENLSVQFLQQGFARTVGAAERSANAEALYAAEQKAKQAKLNLWQFVKEEVEDKDDEEFKQETVAIKVTELTNGNTFWFQNAADATFESVEGRMREFDGDAATPITDFAKGVVCAGIFQQDGAWHRVRIVGRTKNEGEQRVFFIDYGNTDIMQSASLKQLPEDLVSTPGAARQGVLIGCWSPPDTKKPNNRGARALQRLTELIYQHPVTAKIEAKQGSNYYVTLFTEAGPNGEPAVNVNQDLLENGFVKLADANRSPAAVAPLIAELAQYQESAKSQQIGVWELGRDDDEDDGDKRANGRPNKGGKKK